MSEARSAERVRVDAFVKVSGGAGGQELVFRTRDLSESGLFLYTKVAKTYPFKVGQTLHLELFDYDQSVACKVVVARIVEAGSAESDRFPTGFGVKIVELTDDARRALDAMLAKFRAGHAA